MIRTYGKPVKAAFWMNRLGELVEVSVKPDGWEIVYDPGEPKESKHWTERTKRESRDLARRRVAARFSGDDPTVRYLLVAACTEKSLDPLRAAYDHLANGEAIGFDPATWDTKYQPWYALLLRRSWKRLARLLTDRGLDKEDVLTFRG